jgi:hypothetical protein
MSAKKRVTGWIPLNLVQQVERVNDTIEEKYGVTIGIPDAQRMMCVFWARCVLPALEGNEVLSFGDIERIVCATMLDALEHREKPSDR